MWREAAAARVLRDAGRRPKSPSRSSKCRHQVQGLGLSGKAVARALAFMTPPLPDPACWKILAYQLLSLSLLVVTCMYGVCQVLTTNKL